jgi:geranylgeranylglycerol-phosphate geranylgeranyltransferase
MMSKFIWRVSGYIEILRIHNLLVSALAALLGIKAVYAGVTSTPSSITSYLLPISTVTLVAAGGYVINDYFDVDSDLINKPSRPIPSGRVSRDEALILSIILFSIGLLTSYLTGPLSLTYAVVNAFLLVMYSKHLKKRGLIGNLVVSVASANSIIYGGLATSEMIKDPILTINTLLPAFYAGVFTLMREMVKGIEDVAGDLRMNVKTLAITKGVKTASKVAILLMIIIIMISPLPYVISRYGFLYVSLALLTDILLIKSVKDLIKAKSDVELMKTSSRVRSYTKVAMLVGILAFLVDLIFRT